MPCRYNCNMNAAAVITLFVALTVTPLDDAQRAQLSTAGDFDEQFDQGALYPLLHNAATWQPGDEAGAQVPDYASIMQRPADARGGLFLIEGQFAGVPDGQTVAYGPLARPGPWDGKLQWWGVVVEQWSPGVDQPAGDDDNPQAVIAYLVNPPTAADDPPRAGDRVRLVARFYKVWRDVDQNDQTRDYLTFVGHFATVPGGSGSTAPVDQSSSILPGMPALLGVIILLAVGWVALRMAARKAPRHAPPQRDHRDPVTDERDPPLPSDAAEALDAMSRNDVNPS